MANHTTLFSCLGPQIVKILTRPGLMTASLFSLFVVVSPDGGMAHHVSEAPLGPQVGIITRLHSLQVRLRQFICCSLQEVKVWCCRPP